MDFKPVLFSSTGADGNAVYHTNIVMSVGSTLAIACTEAIKVRRRHFFSIKYVTK
jgi:hypothetical protein